MKQLPDARELSRPVFQIVQFYLLGAGVDERAAFCVAMNAQVNVEYSLVREEVAKPHVDVVRSSHNSDRDDQEFEKRYR